MELAARHGSAIKVYSTVDALLADSSIDVVSICSYPDRHAAEAIAEELVALAA